MTKLKISTKFNDHLYCSLALLLRVQVNLTTNLGFSNNGKMNNNYIIDHGTKMIGATYLVITALRNCTKNKYQDHNLRVLEFF